MRMFRRCLLSLALLAFGTSAHAQCQGQDLRDDLNATERSRLDRLLEGMPYATGNRWRAERGDEVIHLVGTMHLNDPRLDAPLERLRPLVASAGALLLEMPRAAQGELQQSLSSRPELLLLEGTSLPDLMPEEDWQALAEAAEQRGIPGPMAARFRPWYLSMMLSMPACAQAALEGGGGLDARIEALAEEAGVPTAALEPYDTVFAIFNEEPLEEQIDWMSAALANEAEGEDGFASTTAAYFDEEVGEMWALSEILLTRSDMVPPEEAAELMREANDALLRNRNLAWLPVILKAAEQHDGPVIAAFGAAHLPGEEGIANLLAQEGFTLTREPF